MEKQQQTKHGGSCNKELLNRLLAQQEKHTALQYEIKRFLDWVRAYTRDIKADAILFDDDYLNAACEVISKNLRGGIPVKKYYTRLTKEEQLHDLNECRKSIIEYQKFFSSRPERLMVALKPFMAEVLYDAICEKIKRLEEE